MEVFGIVGSPKKGGNVDLLVSKVLEGANSRGAETHKIYLNDMHIRYCQSCGVDPHPKFCLFDDDMKEIYAALTMCDAVVLGSPVYFDSVSAQVKLMIDRCNCLMPYVIKPNGSLGFKQRVEKHKKGVFIAVAGKDQKFDTIQVTANGFFKWANIELTESILYAHDDNELGAVKDDREKSSQAFTVGARLTRTAKE